MFLLRVVTLEGNVTLKFSLFAYLQSWKEIWRPWKSWVVAFGEELQTCMNVCKMSRKVELSSCGF